MHDSPRLNSTVSEPPLLARGKVRDVYDLDDALLSVATDRVSCFDVVRVPWFGLDAMSPGRRAPHASKPSPVDPTNHECPETPL